MLDARINFIQSQASDIFVIRAGPEYELIAKNEIGELVMGTPALSEGLMYVRAKNHLFAIGR